MIEFSDYSKRYPNAEGPDIEVFDKAREFKIERGDKVALVGKNGAGKSTLARMILGTESFEGTRDVGYRVTPSFFAQHQAEILDPERYCLGIDAARGRGTNSDTNQIHFRGLSL